MKTITHLACNPNERGQSWVAMSEDYCGCGHCHHPVGWGHTAAEAEADLAGMLADQAEYEADLRAGR